MLPSRKWIIHLILTGWAVHLFTSLSRWKEKLFLSSFLLGHAYLWTFWHRAKTDHLVFPKIPTVFNGNTFSTILWRQNTLFSYLFCLLVVLTLYRYFETVLRVLTRRAAGWRCVWRTCFRICVSSSENNMQSWGGVYVLYRPLKRHYINSIYLQPHMAMTCQWFHWLNSAACVT